MEFFFNDSPQPWPTPTSLRHRLRDRDARKSIRLEGLKNVGITTISVQTTTGVTQAMNRLTGFGQCTGKTPPLERDSERLLCHGKYLRRDAHLVDSALLHSLLVQYTELLIDSIALRVIGSQTSDRR
jgi:hypothetical protein